MQTNAPWIARMRVITIGLAAAAAGIAAPAGTAGAAGAACASHAPAPGNSDPGTTALADGFEDGGLGAWSRVQRGGDATVAVQSATTHDGGCALRVHVSASSTSRGNVSKSLPASSREIWATGWFDVTRQGANRRSNVPTFRFFNGTTRVLDVSRQNGAGFLFVRWRVGAAYVAHVTRARIVVGRWYQIKVHARANGSRSQTVTR